VARIALSSPSPLLHLAVAIRAQSTSTQSHECRVGATVGAERAGAAAYTGAGRVRVLGLSGTSHTEKERPFLVFFSLLPSRLDLARGEFFLFLAQI
jgi:hypothetical protein